jgi:hypothetical protein
MVGVFYPATHTGFVVVLQDEGTTYPDHHATCYNIQLPSTFDFYNIEHLSQQDHD